MIFFILAGLVEGLHKAAYRDTLGQSIYMNADRIGSFKPQDVSFLFVQFETLFPHEMNIKLINPNDQINSQKMLKADWIVLVLLKTIDCRLVSYCGEFNSRSYLYHYFFVFLWSLFAWIYPHLTYLTWVIMHKFHDNRRNR